MSTDNLPEDEQAESHDQSSNTAPGGWNVGPEADDYLAELIIIANHGVAMGITLTVGGSLVTGTLCSGREFFEGLRENFKKGWSDMPDFIGKKFQDRIDFYDNANNTLTVGFIHLRNATVFNGGTQPLPSNGGLLWRGRLEAVDGWAFGLLTPG